MVELSAYVDDDMHELRRLRLDSGASISCVSEEALAKDKDFLLSHGKLHRLITPVKLSGLASAYARVTRVLVGVQLIIGHARCSHNLQVVPKLVCGYLMGHDFVRDYDIHVWLSRRVATMSIPLGMLMGAADYRSTQVIDIQYVTDAVVLELAL